MTEDGLRLKGRRSFKPNFVESHPDRPINTHIAVIASAAEAASGSARPRSSWARPRGIAAIPGFRS